MERTIQYTIDEKFENRTIRDFLLYKGFSRQNIISLKKIPESILLNQTWAYVNTGLKSGDKLCIRIMEKESSQIEPIPYDLSIVYEDEDLLIVNKPYGMPTIPSMNHHHDSLANGVCAYYADKQQSFTYRPVNRLDKNTSGLVLIAKHFISASMLSAAAANGKIDKTYTAIASGILPSCGTIDAPIARCSSSLITRCVNFECGEHAVTHYRVLAQKEKYALVSVRLETGRTHQIRVHFSYIGHPLAGDELYGGSCSLMNRHALHAGSIHFIQPLTGKEISCQIPLPEDMTSFWGHQSS